MAKANSTKLKLSYRGAKLEFGLHKGTGQYRKKFKGQTLYLGNNKDRVLDQWLAKTEEIDRDLRAFPIQRRSKILTVGELCNRFLTDKEDQVESGELAQVTFDEYHRYARLLCRFFGQECHIANLGTDDFSMLRKDLSKPKPQRKDGRIVKRAKSGQLSLNGLASKIRHIRVFFNHAVDQGWIEQVPYNKSFAVPKNKAVKKNQSKQQPKQATKSEIKTLLKCAGDLDKAMILFALNTASGNTDVATLKHSEIGTDGWIDKPRNKTGEERRFKLWPETQEAIARLPVICDLVFTGEKNQSLVPVGKHNPITKRFSRLATVAKVKRQNLSFYSMRHTFQSVADESMDFVATMAVMGHKGTTTSDGYRGKVNDKRIEAVINHVHKWFYSARNK